MRIFLIFAFLAVGQPSQADTAPASCSFSMYPVSENGQLGKVPIIVPSQVSSLDPQEISPITGSKRWRVTLNAEGTSANESYSKAHIGEKIAIFCDGKEVMRPTIQGQSSGTFVIELPDKSP